MPLLDHFQESFGGPNKWALVHAMWAAEIAGRLNAGRLGPQFAARPRRMETSTNGPTAAALSPWTAPQPAASVPADIPSLSEVQVLKTDEGILVAAIEIVSPRNKDRPTAREGFVGKCLDYLNQGVCVVVIDVVTTLRANLHAELCDKIGVEGEDLFTEVGTLYAATYRPTTRSDVPQIDVWASPCRVGEAIPTMPLRLTSDTFVPVEFELTYTEACRRLKVLR
jgi:hypothetical protein